jgi:phosphate transport system substrate-binding protein
MKAMRTYAVKMWRLLPLAALAGSLECGALPSSARGEILASGSDSTLHVMKALAAAFEEETGTCMRLEGGGSGAGANAAIAGQVQLAFLSRALLEKEIEGGLVGVPYAFDGVAVIVNKENPQTDITVTELRDLYTGRATLWKDGRPVVLFNRNTDSGTRQVFQDLVLGPGAAFTKKAAIKHDALLVRSVSKIPSSLAYTSLAEADETVVKVLSINGIKPGAATIRDKSYSLSRTPTLATKGAPSGDVKAFIDFVLGPRGQAIVEGQKLIRIR